MSKTTQLPDPLFAEIDGYANRVAASPVTVIRQAWDEFVIWDRRNLSSSSGMMSAECTMPNVNARA